MQSLPRLMLMIEGGGLLEMILKQLHASVDLKTTGSQHYEVLLHTSVRASASPLAEKRSAARSGWPSFW